MSKDTTVNDDDKLYDGVQVILIEHIMYLIIINQNLILRDHGNKTLKNE